MMDFMHFFDFFLHFFDFLFGTRERVFGIPVQVRTNTHKPVQNRTNPHKPAQNYEKRTFIYKPYRGGESLVYPDLYDCSRNRCCH